MTEYMPAIGLVVSVLLAFVILLLSIIGYFVSGRLKSIDHNLAALPIIQVELASMKVKQEQHSVTLSDCTARLGRVEEHVSNTERVALLEQRIMVSENRLSDVKLWNEKEIDSLRTFRHLTETQLSTLASVTALITKLDDLFIALRRDVDKLLLAQSPSVA